MPNKLLTFATFCLSAFLLSAAPGCAVADQADTEVASGPATDTIDDGRVNNGDSLSDQGAQPKASRRYNDTVPATDGVEAETADTEQLVPLDGIDLADLLEALRPKTATGGM